jgi:CheY-like chemotaxis protein/HPt (histidine-containing phosphotransfer) domain-containing protein
VLLNFATNAVKATQGGRILLSAQADPPDQAGYRVTLAVTDTGIGIADSDIPRLFQDFGMLGRNGGLAEEGTGLGLAICRRLADAMGGTVGVTSAPDQGSRFWLALTLPAAKAPAAPVPDNAGSTAILRGLRVLVADDHDTIRSLVCRGLRDSGAITTEAADGKAAVDLAQAQPFDLILMDLRMPLLDGSEAALRIRRGGGPSAGAQIIGLTARQTPATAIEYRNIAFDGWLGKPLELQKLVALLYQAAPQPENLPEMTDAFDDEKLRQLQAVDGGLLLAGALESLTEEIIEARDQIALLLAKGDGLAASRLAHKLAGACDFLGARALSARLRSFEAMARQDDNLPRLLAELPHLVAALDLARDQIARLIAGARGPLRSVPSAPG